jgi:hypothetical protein
MNLWRIKSDFLLICAFNTEISGYRNFVGCETDENAAATNTEGIDRFFIKKAGR